MFLGHPAKFGVCPTLSALQRCCAAAPETLARVAYTRNSYTAAAEGHADAAGRRADESLAASAASLRRPREWRKDAAFTR